MPRRTTDETSTATLPDIELLPSVPLPTDEVIDRWYVETFCNIGLDTQLYNRFFAAKERLKQEIAASISQSRKE